MSCCTPESSPPTTCCTLRKKSCCAIAAGLLALVLVLGAAWLLRDGLRDFQGEKRAVSVRGLAEREVKADLAVWPFALSTTDNTLTAAQDALAAQEASLRAFLQEQDLSLTDVSLLRYEVQDLLAQQYRPDSISQGRYVLSKVLLLRTAEVDKVQAASQAIDTLVKRGVALGRGAQPSYIFTKLNDIKPGMIKEATANAYDAARQFADDSGAQVGDIVTASQGVFSIQGRDEISYLGDGVPFGPDMQLNKNVRVVTTVTYKLD